MTPQSPGPVEGGEGEPIQFSGNPGRLYFGLQALPLALRIGGLDGLRSGAVKIGGRP